MSGEVDTETEEPKKKIKRTWVHEINTKRTTSGEYQNLCQELSSHEDRFYHYFHMSKSSFEELHDLLRPKISKLNTNFRETISSRERLTICLRYLITGDSYQTIATSYCVGRSTVSKIMEDVCKAIWDVLQPLYMPTPTEETWRESEAGYRLVWQLPNCVASIDGKHVRMQFTRGGVEMSFVLLTLIDPFYKFIIVDIGSYGSYGDSRIFENTNFYKTFINGNILLPPKPLPNSNDPVPHVIIGDEGFTLKPDLIKPFPKAVVAKDERKEIYNLRLCRARRVVENTFGHLTSKFKVLMSPMKCDVETATVVVKAACCLHNYIKTKHGTFIAEEDSQPKQKKHKKNNKNALVSFRPTKQRSSNIANQVREIFVDYFNS